MSLEQALSQKLNLDPEVSSSSSNQSDSQNTLTGSSVTFKNPVSTSLTSGSSNCGRRGRSPIRAPSTDSPPPPYPHTSNSIPVPKSDHKNHRSVSLSPSSPNNIRKNTTASSTPPSASHLVGPGGERVHSVRLTRKIFNNWRSACGKTKDRTKDFIRRWKTLPENHPDFDHLVGGDSPTAPHQRQLSTAGVNSMDGTGPTPTFGKMRQLVKKQSESEVMSDGHHEDPGGGSGIAGPSVAKSSTGWSVHVWATYVQRGTDEDDIGNEEPSPGRDFLSDFQKIKLTYFFRHVLDMNRDDVISAEDFVALNQRIRHYIEWSSESIEFHILKEVHSGFLECFLNQPLDECSHMYYCSAERETRQNVNVDEWLDVWGNLLHNSRSLEDLPLWLQYFPKILFQVINKSGSSTISKEELRAFYTMFLGIDFRVVNESMDVIYNAMTDEGQCKINYGLFKLCFTNFLLGKYPHGPGQYLFGICCPQSVRCSFPIDYSALNTPPSDLEPYDPEKDKSQSNRRSVIV